jgi:hypothetical protein
MKMRPSINSEAVSFILSAPLSPIPPTFSLIIPLCRHSFNTITFFLFLSVAMGSSMKSPVPGVPQLTQATPAMQLAAFTPATFRQGMVEFQPGTGFPNM